MRRSLPKPATSIPASSPVICLWPERFLFIGQLGRVASHRHAAAVCLIALEGELRVRVSAERRWWVGGSAVIPAGCMHELDLGNRLTAVFYNDPHRPYYRRLSARERQAPIFGLTQEDRLRAALSALYTLEHVEQAARLEREFAQALEAYDKPIALDPRIQRALSTMQQDLTQNYPLPVLASAAALSPSRLQHLFLAETGVPLRRLRTWIRFRHALDQIAAGATFTAAALDAGFASSTHFSHAFKAMFGVSAASVLASRHGPRILRRA